MSIVALNEVLDKLPIAQLDQTLTDFLQPLTNLLPDQRLRQNAKLAVQGILAAQSPLISQMARTIPRTEVSTRAASARFYRFVHNQRVGSRRLVKGLYRLTRQILQQQQQSQSLPAPLPYLVVAVDPVNFEKPYTTALAGVSKVHKATPPNLKGGARVAPGYPALTASVVNTVVPVVTYANWFSWISSAKTANSGVQSALPARC
jgi:hypothetical protein